jgi:hypothetical protein
MLSFAKRNTEMRKQIIAIVAAVGIAFAATTPAKAWYGGWGYGGWGYGGGAAIAGMAVGGLLAGAMMAQTYSYPYAYGAPVYGGYGYGYGYAPVAPVYAAPVAVPAYRAPAVKKQIIIKNSPGATVYEEDDIFGGW